MSATEIMDRACRILAMSMETAGKLLAPLVGGFLSDYLFVQAPFFLSIVLLSVLLLMLLFKSRNKKVDLSHLDTDVFKYIREFMSNRRLKDVGLMGMIMHANTPALLVFIPLHIMEYFGLSYTFVGIVLFLHTLTHTVQFYFGALSDRYGRHPFIAMGCFMVGVCWILCSLSGTYLVLALSFAIMGLGGSMWNISAWSLMSDVGEKLKKEGFVVTTYLSVAKIGSFMSFAVSGIIVQFYGIQMLFLINGSLTAAAALWYWKASSS
jgi:MFS family permease